MKLRFGAFVWVALGLCTPLAGADKIDEAIDLTKSGPFPVFVRMSDQVIGGAGECETLCRDRSRKPRSQNRKEVLSLLRDNADKSWEKIGKTAEVLVEKGEIQATSRWTCRRRTSAKPSPLIATTHSSRSKKQQRNFSWILEGFWRPKWVPQPVLGVFLRCFFGVC